MHAILSYCIPRTIIAIGPVKASPPPLRIIIFATLRKVADKYSSCESMRKRLEQCCTNLSIIYVCAHAPLLILWSSYGSLCELQRNKGTLILSFAQL